MSNAPQYDSSECGQGYEPLNSRKSISHRADWDYYRPPSRIERYEKEDPDDQDRNNANGDGDEEPRNP